MRSLIVHFLGANTRLLQDQSPYRASFGPAVQSIKIDITDQDQVHIPILADVLSGLLHLSIKSESIRAMRRTLHSLMLHGRDGLAIVQSLDLFCSEPAATSSGMDDDRLVDTLRRISTRVLIIGGWEPDMPPILRITSAMSRFFEVEYARGYDRLEELWLDQMAIQPHTIAAFPNLKLIQGRPAPLHPNEQLTLPKLTVIHAIIMLDSALTNDHRVLHASLHSPRISINEATTPLGQWATQITMPDVVKLDVHFHLYTGDPDLGTIKLQHWHLTYLKLHFAVKSMGSSDRFRLSWSKLKPIHELSLLESLSFDGDNSMELVDLNDAALRHIATSFQRLRAISIDFSNYDPSVHVASLQYLTARHPSLQNIFVRDWELFPSYNPLDGHKFSTEPSLTVTEVHIDWLIRGNPVSASGYTRIIHATTRTFLKEMFPNAVRTITMSMELFTHHCLNRTSTLPHVLHSFPLLALLTELLPPQTQKDDE